MLGLRSIMLTIKKCSVSLKNLGLASSLQNNLCGILKISIKNDDLKVFLKVNPTVGRRKFFYQDLENSCS